MQFRSLAYMKFRSAKRPAYWRRGTLVSLFCSPGLSGNQTGNSRRTFGFYSEMREPVCAVLSELIFRCLLMLYMRSIRSQAPRAPTRTSSGSPSSMKMLSPGDDGRAGCQRALAGSLAAFSGSSRVIEIDFRRRSEARHLPAPQTSLASGPDPARGRTRNDKCDELQEVAVRRLPTRSG